MSGPLGPVVRLPRPLAEAILRHALEGRPNEACGLVVGSGPWRDGGRALRYVPCRNAAASPSRYVVHRDDLFSVISALDDAGEELWGVVHSHVRSAAIPSATDVAEATWPSAVYLLVSLAGAAEPSTLSASSIRAWRIAGDAATELALEVEDELAEPAQAETMG